MRWLDAEAVHAEDEDAWSVVPYGPASTDDALREENERLRAEAESIRYIMNLSVEEFEVLAAHALAAVTGGRE